MKIHELLGLTEDSAEAEIRKKYRFSCPHPDRGGTIEEFQIWNHALQEWEESLVEETKEQKFLRYITQQALKRAYESGFDFNIDFSLHILIVIQKEIDKLEKQRRDILSQQESFRQSATQATLKIKESDSLEIILDEINSQLKNVPDLLSFVEVELAFVKEVQKTIQGKQKRTTQRVPLSQKIPLIEKSEDF